MDSTLVFKKLIPVGSQYTTVETPDVRFVYQPFDELYVVLITNKDPTSTSELLDHLTESIFYCNLLLLGSSCRTCFHFVARRSLDHLFDSVMPEPAVPSRSFELLCAFDEVVSLGYKGEREGLQQIRKRRPEGESHEERRFRILSASEFSLRRGFPSISVPAARDKPACR